MSNPMPNSISGDAIDLLQRFSRNRAEIPDEPYLIDERYRSYTWRESLDTIEAIAKSLSVLLEGEGERVSILSHNCPEWVLADWAIIMSGHISAPLFTTMTREKIAYATSFLNIKVLFLGHAPNWEAVKGAIPEGVTIIALPQVEPQPGVMSFEDFIALGRDRPVPGRRDPDSVCSLVLTSGTTGNPKAVMHSLRSLDCVGASFRQLTNQEPLQEKRFLCHMPLAHIGERIGSLVLSLLVGGTITFNAGPATFVEDLRKVRPTMLLAVPRIWERLVQVVDSEFDDRDRSWRERLEAGDDDALAVRIREFLGVDAARCCISGGALSPAFVKEAFQAIDVEVLDFYGQTEILPLTCQRPRHAVSGSVGTAAPGFELKLDPQGEILGRGPGMALGYFNDEDSTARTFGEGWVRTGDRGRLDDDGNLFIIGRLNDEFKTAKGKFVAPGPIENRFSEIDIVEQPSLVGLGLTQPIMICTLSDKAKTLSDGDVQKILIDETEKLNGHLEPHERIAALLICRTLWTVESGMLTHTQKVIREKVRAAFADKIERLATSMSDGARDLVEWA